MELTAMHYSLQYQHLVEGISEHQRGRWMNRNEVLAGLEGGHVEEIIATPIIQPKSECLHLRADSPNIVAFHYFTCTMDFAPIKWTCTVFLLTETVD